MALALLKQLNGPWERVRGGLRMDLDRVQVTLNQYISSNDERWDNLFQTINQVWNLGSVGSRPTVDWSKGPFQRLTLTANTTFTLANAVEGATYTLLIGTGAGALTAAWPSNVKWAGGTPTITITANRYDIVTFYFVTALNTYFGSISQNYQ